MTLPQTILATATASEELPDSWHWIALVAFVSAAVLSVALLVTAFLSRRRVLWFYTVATVAFLAGGLAFTFLAYVYVIDGVARRPAGTEGASTVWQSFSVPSLPVFATLTALIIYRAAKNRSFPQFF